MKSTFFRGLLSVLIGAIASLIAVQAASPWFYVVTVLGIVITYFVQNGILKPISLFGTIDVTDLIKGLLIAIGTGLSTYAAQLITSEFILKDLLQVVVGAVVLFLTQSYATDSSGTVLPKKIVRDYELKSYKDVAVRSRKLNNIQ